MGEGSVGAVDLERAIERLPEVRAARVVANATGRIVEIHLVSDGSKAPKQLTRDVETVAATHGLDIDRRMISIAQMPAEAGHFIPPKLAFASITVGIEGIHGTCRVRVTRGDEDGTGEATAPASLSGRGRLIAGATIAAASALFGFGLPADCDNALVVDVGDHRVAVAVLVFVNDEGVQAMSPGVSPVRRDPDEALARAVVDAINRHHGA